MREMMIRDIYFQKNGKEVGECEEFWEGPI